MSRRFNPADKATPSAWVRHSRYLLRREWRKYTTRLRLFWFYALRGKAPPRIIFLHLPKTAGVSTATCILRRVGWRRTGRSTDLSEMPWRLPLADQQIARANRALFVYGHMSFAAIDRLDADRQNYIFTFLREPKARLWSFYRQLHTYLERSSLPRSHGSYPLMAKAAALSAEAFFLTRDPAILAVIDNHIVRQLAGAVSSYPIEEKDWPRLLERAAVNLSRIDFVGFFETYEADFRALMQQIKLAAPRTVPHINRGLTDFDALPETEIKAEVARAVDRLTRWDRALYAHALKVRQDRQRMASVPLDFPDDFEGLGGGQADCCAAQLGECLH
jgi:hypothetical protein